MNYLSSSSSEDESRHKLSMNLFLLQIFLEIVQSFLGIYLMILLNLFNDFTEFILSRADVNIVFLSITLT